MASFSIHDLLGLGKESSTTGGSCKSVIEFPAGTAKINSSSKDFAATNPPKTDNTAAAGEEDHDVDVETFDEDDDAHHQLVTVEVRTVRHASSLSRSSSSRKRKRATEQPDKEREATPDSEGE